MNFTKYLILAFPAGMTAFGDIVPDFVARADVHELTSAVVAFQLDWGRYPTEAEGLSAIIHRPADIPEAKWKPYLKRLPTADPWGGAYVYRYPGMHGTFDLYSLGEDRTTKTGGADSDDINSWDRARSWERHYNGKRASAARRSDALFIITALGLAGFTAFLIWQKGRPRAQKRVAKLLHSAWAGYWIFTLLQIWNRESSATWLQLEPQFILLPVLACVWLPFAVGLWFDRRWAWIGSFAFSVLSLFVVLYLAWMCLAIAVEENWRSTNWTEFAYIVPAVLVTAVLLHMRHHYFRVSCDRGGA